MGILILLAVLVILAVLAGLLGALTDKSGPDADFRTGAFVASGVFTVIVVIVFLISAFTSVGVGDVGVPVTFGHAGKDLQPGIHLKAPWTSVVQMNVRTQQLNLGSTGANGDEVHSSDNVTSNVDVSVLYNVTSTAANSLYRNVGADYLDAVIIPSVRSALQDQAKNYTAVALTAADRDDFSSGVLSELQRELAPRGVDIQQVLVREVDLPSSVASAVNAKVAAQQSAQAQQYVLQQTETQVQIAEQQAKANEALSNSLTPNIICNNWVNALAKGQISGPIYTTPCSSSATQPTILVPGK